jgi:hypothetical protein
MVAKASCLLARPERFGCCQANPNEAGMVFVRQKNIDLSEGAQAS